MAADIRTRDQRKVQAGTMSVAEYSRKHGRSPKSHMAQTAREKKRNKEKVARQLKSKMK
jgi:hypothetical protein|tara:strand:+ start:281 stop:457 length:177 start_codon:yes stop_codon:yes gene_type:complete